MGGKALVIATVSSRLATIQAAAEAAGWEVAAFKQPQQALERLKSGDYGAIFCDSNLAGASPKGFLAWTRRAAPHTSFYLVGATPLLDGSQTDKVLSYPPGEGNVPGPTDATRRPAPTYTPAASVPLAGNTELIALDALLDMMGLAEQDAVIDLGGAGKLHLNKGRIQHVQADGQSGLAALAHLLSLESSNFQVLPHVQPARATVNLPASTALTEAARLADEHRRGRQLIATVADACRATRAVTVGYLHGSNCEDGRGDKEVLYQRAKALLTTVRDLAGGRPQQLLLATDSSAIAICVYAEDQLLAAEAPGEAGERLLKAVTAAIDSAQLG